MNALILIRVIVCWLAAKTLWPAAGTKVIGFGCGTSFV